MKVGRLMSHAVISADVGDSVREVAVRMRAGDVSAMPVLDDGCLVGILTERDLVGALVDGVDPRATRVPSCMTAMPVSVTSDEDVSEAAFAMVRAHARHLPVVDDGRLVGILSSRDLLVLDLTGDT